MVSFWLHRFFYTTSRYSTAPRWNSWSRSRGTWGRRLRLTGNQRLTHDFSIMFDLHKLGWHSFQQLCHTIGGEILGQTLESFADSNDGGRDGAFKGRWNLDGHEDLEGYFVIQCKFTGQADGRLTPSTLLGEVDKAKALVQQGICDSYILMTNATISGTSHQRIVKMFENAGAKHVCIFEATWLTRQILENKRLRMLVPRVYGLGDLSEILDERAYGQSQVILEMMREDIGKVVITDAYQRAAAALDNNGFVLLIGEPAAGKTTIASLLAMAALDKWNAPTLVLHDPAQVIDHWNTNQQTQFFWIDDAFGVTQHDDVLVDSWSRFWPTVQTMVRRGAKIVLTSRDYIYNRARDRLKEPAFPLLNESQVVVDVRELSEDEKRQILYNHIKLGNQPTAFRTAIKPFLEEIAAHRRFVPETARRLGDSAFTKSLRLHEAAIQGFVERREQFLQGTIRGLDAHSRAILALIFLRRGRLQSPIELEVHEERAIGRLGSDWAACTSAVTALEGSFVHLSHIDGDAFWQFRHPTIGDAYAAVLVENPEHLTILITGSDPNKLIAQVTCGDVGIEQATIIPRSLFTEIMVKLDEIAETARNDSDLLARDGATWRLFGFLANRCVAEFLQLYFQQHQDLLEQVSNPRFKLDYSPEVPLVVRLHEFDLLPEEIRKRFIDKASEDLLEGRDAGALASRRIRTLYREEEFEELIQRATDELLPNLDDIRDNEEWNWDEDVSPDAWMLPLKKFLSEIGTYFQDEHTIADLVDEQTSRIESWINEHSDYEDEREERLIGSIDIPIVPQSTRSIFDDIDAE